MALPMVAGTLLMDQPLSMVTSQGMAPQTVVWQTLPVPCSIVSTSEASQTATASSARPAVSVLAALNPIKTSSVTPGAPTAAIASKLMTHAFMTVPPKPPPGITAGTLVSSSGISSIPAVRCIASLPRATKQAAVLLPKVSQTSADVSGVVTSLATCRAPPTGIFRNVPSATLVNSTGVVHTASHIQVVPTTSINQQVSSGPRLTAPVSNAGSTLAYGVAPKVPVSMRFSSALLPTGTVNATSASTKDYSTSVAYSSTIIPSVVKNPPDLPLRTQAIIQGGPSEVVASACNRTDVLTAPQISEPNGTHTHMASSTTQSAMSNHTLANINMNFNFFTGNAVSTVHSSCSQLNNTQPKQRDLVAVLSSVQPQNTPARTSRTVEVPANLVPETFSMSSSAGSSFTTWSSQTQCTSKQLERSGENPGLVDSAAQLQTALDLQLLNLGDLSEQLQGSLSEPMAIQTKENVNPCENVPFSSQNCTSLAQLANVVGTSGHLLQEQQFTSVSGICGTSVEGTVPRTSESGIYDAQSGQENVQEEIIYSTGGLAAKPLGSGYGLGIDLDELFSTSGQDVFSL